MGNSKFFISKEAKDIINTLKVILEIDETPTIIKLALAKGISNLDPNEQMQKFTDNGNWQVPENIIKDRDYLLFKHIINNELNKLIPDKDINEYFAFYIEKGSRALQEKINSKTSFDDLRVLLLD